jgi:hypothetical protein
MSFNDESPNLVKLYLPSSFIDGDFDGNKRLLYGDNSVNANDTSFVLSGTKLKPSFKCVGSFFNLKNNKQFTIPTGDFSITLFSIEGNHFKFDLIY